MPMLSLSLIQKLRRRDLELTYSISCSSQSSATSRKPLNLRVLTAWLLVVKRNVRVDMTEIRRLRTLERDAEKARQRVDIAKGF